LTKHVLTRPTLKTAEVALDGPRAELADAISEIESAQRAADVASEAVELAQSRLRAAKSGHAVAVAALEDATAPPKTLDQKLKGAYSVDEQLDIVDEHNASLIREPLRADDLKRLRQAIDAAADELVIATRWLEVAEARARPTLSALNRAKDRRQRAVYDVARPEVGRLMREAQDLVERLGAKRAELSYVANGLVEPLGGDRRQAFYFLGRQFYPEESSMRSENDLTRRDFAVAAWMQFAESIAKDAATPFPAM
jgi:hypothetical protein